MNLTTAQSEERKALTTFLKKNLKDDANTEWDIKMSFQDSYVPYDAIAIRYDRVTHKMLNVLLIEAKVREKEYDSYLLEKKKFDRMFDSCKENAQITECIYVNFLQDKVVWYNLNKIKDDIIWEERLQPKQTIRPELGKVVKTVSMLPTSLAKVIPFVYNEEHNKMLLEEDRKDKWNTKKNFNMGKYLFPQGENNI